MKRDVRISREVLPWEIFQLASAVRVCIWLKFCFKSLPCVSGRVHGWGHNTNEYQRSLHKMAMNFDKTRGSGDVISISNCCSLEPVDIAQTSTGWWPLSQRHTILSLWYLLREFMGVISKNEWRNKSLAQHGVLLLYRDCSVCVTFHLRGSNSCASILIFYNCFLSSCVSIKIHYRVHSLHSCILSNTPFVIMDKLW